MPFYWNFLLRRVEHGDAVVTLKQNRQFDSILNKEISGTGEGMGTRNISSQKHISFASVLVFTVMMTSFFFAGISDAKVLHEEDFSKGAAKGKVTGGVFHPSAGWGSSIESQSVDRQGVWESIESAIDPSLKGIRSGTVQFRVKRIRPTKVTYDVGFWKASYDTVFELLYPNNTSAFSVMVMWDFDGDPAKCGLVVNHFGRWSASAPPLSPAWSNYYPFPGNIPVGKWVHVSLVWGPNAETDNKVFINGKLTASAPDPASQTFVLPSANFGDYLDKADRLRFGVESGPGGMYPGGTSFAVHSAIAGLNIQDVMLDTFDLSGIAPVIRSVTDDSFKIPGISGKLVAGDKVNVTMLAVPGGSATFDMGNVKAIPMEEVPATAGAPGIPAVDNGTYRGSYTIKPGDDFENGQVAGNFASSDNVAAEPVMSSSKWTIETKPAVTFKIDRKDLPADSATKVRIKLVAKDANGNPVKGRHLKLTLETTSEYTGAVGAGDFGKDVGATIETHWHGSTDSWGEVEFDYTAGFAAKTVILSAKDLDSGGVTVDYLTAYKEASIDIVLTPPVNRAATRRGMQYLLKVEAFRTELTADGRSRSVIRATLLDPNGVPVAGDPVVFTLSSANGTLRAITGTTDSSGTATAEYTAGKKIGIVVVAATATLRNASGNVSITLLSDAPAKVILKARPATLPADGNSRTDIGVKVTDINDNPNSDTKVEYRISRGGGKLDYPDRLTDRFGDASNRYTAGTTAGTATIVATVRSKVPTEEDLSRARNVLFVPYSGDVNDIRVEKWLKKKGDTVVKGDPLMEYTVGRSRQVRTLVAPYDLRIEQILVQYWNDAEVGQTLAEIIPMLIPGSTNPPPAQLAPRRR